MEKGMLETFVSLITSAFGLVAALAWNSAIQEVFRQSELSKWGPVVYAVLVTFLAVTVTYYVGKLVSKKDKK